MYSIEFSPFNEKIFRYPQFRKNGNSENNQYFYFLCNIISLCGIIEFFYKK